MTPAINLAKKKKVVHTVHEYSHDTSSKSYGLEAVEKLKIAKEQVFKTLVVVLDNKELAVGVIPVDATLSMKRIAKVVGSKKAAMAEKAAVERTTGYVLGGVSPLAQKKALRTIIDSSAQHRPTVYVSAGRRGLEIELAPDDLTQLTRGTFADLCL